MSLSRVLGLMVVSAWLAAGCTSPKKIDVGGTCILNSDCMGSLVCTMGKCHDACHKSADCPTGQSCVKTSDSVICQLPAEVPCGGASSCRSGLSCAPDQHCRTGCLSIANCTGDQVCVGNFCVDPNDPHLVDGQLSGTTNDAGADTVLADAGTSTDVVLSPADAGSADGGVDAPLTLRDAGNGDGGVDVPVGSLDAGLADAVDAGDSGGVQDSGGAGAQTCKVNAECESVHCVDGFCCDKPCSGTCEACNVPKLEGTCSPIPAGTDPAAECPDKGPCVSTCNGKGACSPVCGEVGAACSGESDCRIAHCVDGYCCDVLCSGLCEACNVAGHEGTCTPVPAGKDPAGECDAAAPSTCQLNGFCDGKGLCQFYGAETACNDGQDICTSGDHCDGKGACVGGQSAPNFTPCTVVTTPDYAYDICVHGKCVSPGTCTDNSCNAPSIHFPLPDTSQRQCQDSAGALAACPGSAGGVTCASTDYCGQDAQYGWDATHAASERFTRAGTWEPTVTDNVTELMWQGCPAGLNASACTNGTAVANSFANAMAYCAGSSWGGFTDWRLSDQFEILTLGDFGNGRIDPVAFPNLSAGLVWTTANASGYHAALSLGSWGCSGGAYYSVLGRALAYDGGSAPCAYYSGTGTWTLCVRGLGTSRASSRFIRTNGNEPVVTDSDTSLVWQGCAAGLSGSLCTIGAATTHNWHDALQYCQAIAWGGYDDWYLPNLLELQTIVDGALPGTAFDAVAFPATPTSLFFISSTSQAASSRVWYVSYLDGSYADADKVSGLLAVRCVRKPN